MAPTTTSEVHLINLILQIKSGPEESLYSEPKLHQCQEIKLNANTPHKNSKLFLRIYVRTIIPTIQYDKNQNAAISSFAGNKALTKKYWNRFSYKCCITLLKPVLS